MLKWGRLKKRSIVVGIEFQADGIAVVAQVRSDGVPEILHMDYLTFADAAEALQLLTDWVATKQLSGSICHVALAQDHYQLLLVEPPDVPDDEMRNAIRWRLKDLINIPLEQAAIDVFALPADGTRAQKKMMYVVATQDQKIKSIRDLILSAGLQLESIDIGELAIRNLANTLLCDDSSERGVAVARIRQGGGSVYIYRKGNMYLARSFSLNYKAGLLDDLPEENLALELQRSVDYYERQMGQAPPTVIYVCGENILEDKLNAKLKASLAIQIQLLDPTAVVLLKMDVDAGLSQQCLGAIGVSIRQALVP